MAFLIYEVPIGLRFAYNGTAYKVVESSDDTCKGCSLEHDEKSCNECPFYCTKEFRLDRKNVIFKESNNINCPYLLNDGTCMYFKIAYNRKTKCPSKNCPWSR